MTSLPEPALFDFFHFVRDMLGPALEQARNWEGEPAPGWADDELEAAAILGESLAWLDLGTCVGYFPQPAADEWIGLSLAANSALAEWAAEGIRRVGKAVDPAPHPPAVKLVEHREFRSPFPFDPEDLARVRAFFRDSLFLAQGYLSEPNNRGLVARLAFADEEAWANYAASLHNEIDLLVNSELIGATGEAQQVLAGVASVFALQMYRDDLASLVGQLYEEVGFHGGNQATAQKLGHGIGELQQWRLATRQASADRRFLTEASVLDEFLLTQEEFRPVIRDVWPDGFFGFVASTKVDLDRYLF